jgi:hypothetical protein
MIERYHFLKLRPEHATPAGRAEVVARCRAVLPGIPGVRSVVVGAPADAEAAQAWDVSIVVRFADLAAVGPYRADPDHRRFVDEFLAPRVEGKKAWNFTTDE